MPTYEYRCLKCSHEYEKREGFDAPAAQKCPKCRATSQRVFHPAPIVFKGSGFYATDSRPAQPAAESGPESDSGKTPDSPASKEPDGSESSKTPDGSADIDAERAAAG